MLPLRHWVFDLDGTLTRAVHDFAAIRSALEIEPNADILQHLASLPQAVAAQKHAWLLEHERQLAQQAQPAQGAVELLNYLHEQGAQLAILTRNARELALLSLKVLGVAQYFAAPCIIGRDEAAPKPDPQGLQHLAAHWQVTPKQLVLVGDFHFDLACARRRRLGDFGQSTEQFMAGFGPPLLCKLQRLAGAVKNRRPELI